MPTPERLGREGDTQPMPVPNNAEDIQEQVIKDIEVRREVGIKRYGTALQPVQWSQRFTGRLRGGSRLGDVLEAAFSRAIFDSA